MIIDIHAHLDRRKGSDRRLARAAYEAGVNKIVLMGGPKQYDYATNDQVLAAAEHDPDMFLPFAYFRLGRDYPAAVDQFRSQGFFGLYCSLPQNDYDCKEYYLTYARAAQHGMPIIFELGLVPHSDRDHVSDVRCRHMRPVFLDSIARAFPELTLIGTRLGSPWYEEACEVLRCNNNLYFDLSGIVLRAKGPDFFRSMLWWDEAAGAYGTTPRALGPWKHMLFGSAVHCKHLPAVLNDYNTLLDGLELDEATRADVMALNAIRALGLD
jgi:predicted TIM-barrel fold metal-dependent hydrolase